MYERKDIPNFERDKETFTFFMDGASMEFISSIFYKKYKE